MLESRNWRVTGGNPASYRTPFQRIDVFTIHWADAPFWSRTTSFRLWLRIVRILWHLACLRARGVKLVWFVHNLAPHALRSEEVKAWQFYTRALSFLIDGWITLAPATRDYVRAQMPALASKASIYIWHPPYPMTEDIRHQIARASQPHHEGEVVFGHIGALRRNKGLEALITAFGSWEQAGNAKLILAGRASDRDFKNLLDQLVGINPRVELHFGWLDELAFEIWLETIDVFVASYRDFLHSGAMVHALSRNRLILTRRHPFTEDLQRVVGTDWVILHEGMPTAADLERALVARDRVRGRTPNLSALDPTVNAARLDQFLRSMIYRVPAV